MTKNEAKLYLENALNGLDFPDRRELMVDDNKETMVVKINSKVQIEIHKTK